MMLEAAGQRLSLCLALVAVLFSAQAQEWQAIPEDQQRLDKPAVTVLDEKAPDINRSSKEENPETEATVDGQVEFVDPVYDAGDGVIDGAFGILFAEQLSEEVIKKKLGWIAVPKLPGFLAYIGTVKPFDLHAYSVQPTSLPNALSSGKIRYRVYIDFNEKPLWIHADSISNINNVISILKRKYGTPDRETDRLIKFERAPNQLVIRRNGSVGSLDYYAMESFGNYLEHRNLSLRKKHKGGDRVRLNETETIIMKIADHMVELRQNLDQVFGMPFGKRVGFLAKPDEFVEFTPPNPLQGTTGGLYEIMVSPELLPVMIRYRWGGNDEDLLRQKMIFDYALEIAFGGFLKRTSKHSVLSMEGNSISTMIRQGKFTLNIIDGSENKKYNIRWNAAELARQQAAEAKRLRELKRIEDLLALEARRKREAEIKEEKGF